MNYRSFLVVLFASLSCSAAVAEDGIAERIFRPARFQRGNTNLVPVQPIDDACWIWHPADSGTSKVSMEITHGARNDKSVSNVMVFQREFTCDKAETIEFDVSADERFYLTLDGQFVARGPNRAAVENWQYQSYRTKLAPGRHVFRAVVTKLGDHAPLAQLSYRGGFIFKAYGTLDAALTTGKAAWMVGRYAGMRPNGADDGAWGTGSQFVIEGSGPYAVEPTEWTDTAVIRMPAGHAYPNWGARTEGWMLFPTQLPDQTESHVRPGAFRALAKDVPWRGEHVYTEAETKSDLLDGFNALLKDRKVLTIPAHTKIQVAWDLGRYYCAYPRAVLEGKGAKLSWAWTESSRNGSDRRKGQRDEIVGKFLLGYGETFLVGEKAGEFSAPWFRCGRWCRLDIETGDAPLAIKDLELVESRYPLEMDSAFSSPEDPSLQDIRRICARAMQMCCHEMLFDCPFYEQQMYPGDTRLQLLVLSALSRDDRMIKRAIEIYDLATRDDGQCPFNYPTRGTQEGFTYTLCYLAMYGDYAMNHADRDWLRARLPGLRKSMAGCETYENAQGLLEKTPGWNFMDWTTEWKDSAVPNSTHGHDLNSFVNLFWLIDMQSAATAERALGNELQALYWEEKAEKLKKAIVAAFWDESRGLFADTAAKKTFSEHSQALAILSDVLPPEKRDICFRHLVEDADLSRTTVYFNYYLFEAYFKMGRADLFLKRLGLWRDYVKLGVTTLLEAPDSGKNGQLEARSDCHAWGAHPIWFMQTGLAGIRSAAPFFAKVRVAPCPGGLKELHAKHPHPDGFVTVDLAFAGGRATGRVDTPVPGEFVYGGQVIPLKRGANVIR